MVTSHLFWIWIRRDLIIWASWIRIKTLKNILKDTEGFGTDPHPDPYPLVRGDPRSGSGSVPVPNVTSPEHCLHLLIFTGFRIRIRIDLYYLSCWIRIRIQIADPDPGGQK